MRLSLTGPLRPNSLSVRLIAISALWTAIAVAAAGVILTSLYRGTVERNFDERLEQYFLSLVGALSIQTEEFTDPGNLGEPRFENIHTGWYWQVSQNGVPALWSQSLQYDTITVPAGARTDEEGFTRFTTFGPVGEVIRGISRTPTLGDRGPFEIVIAGNATAMQGEIAAFRTSVIVTLAVFGLGLILSTFIQVRWGLRPLDAIRRSLADLRTGKAARFDCDYPSEIEPMAKELNALIDSNQQIIDRARTHVGNLAHALKTPLSVITNESRTSKGPFAQKVAEQAALMSKQINHHLDRARIAARSHVIGAVTDVEPVVNRLARAMRRIYEDKRINISAEIPNGVRFRGEQQDFEEIVGNLTDNACKWAKERVSITVARDGGTPAAANDRLIVMIDDDGPGLTPEQAAEATQRGKRLDESKPGSGLGLSIVTDLVGLYQGSFKMCSAPTGGLRAEVILPAA